MMREVCSHHEASKRIVPEREGKSKYIRQPKCYHRFCSVLACRVPVLRLSVVGRKQIASAKKNFEILSNVYLCLESIILFTLNATLDQVSSFLCLFILVISLGSTA